ncbi:biotin--[acetyl-CoA-carboxylase] ligase [Paenibacillus sp. TRM 82003]|uniref:biotin--[acetyl-CoA-carboxylase] ligase n=1 Tax=Kineococcus sp. TRM81007 TaxID=2925831 RepID=UPI001F5A73F1|nr:biotin--[acetyl-CoA-carboxylase] ligase [Kineococcus sp. TRM81007]MCI2238332.1 biotin--[acetyl-CoA-carboxylase] ligase [Kineococcus sp. TRM81007]MCI3923996.1 biotin--[acetyl-CoA-carboxylase] ligase [Paenibacillus sp. TRM 82003]
MEEAVDRAGAQRPWTDLERPPLRVLALRRALVGPGGWAALDVVARTGSTNADLLERAAREDVPDGTVLVAEHQDAGRGRLGRTWSSPPRAGLAVSVLLRPAAAPERWSWLPLLTGVAVVDALGALGVDAGLKWPNDVLVAGPGRPGKVGGVLAEVRGGAVVLGAGVNVGQREQELPPAAPGLSAPGAPAPVPPTSLVLAGARSTDRDTVLRRYLRALRTRLDEWAADPGATAAAYRAACRTLGAPVRAHLPGGDVLTGTAEDVDGTGRLVVRTSGGAATSLAAADVVHLRGV